MAISVSQGRITDFVPLGTEVDEPGSMSLIDGRLYVVSPSPRAFDAVDVEVDAPDEAALEISIATGPAGKSAPYQIPLAELDEHDLQRSLDESGNRLYVQRTPGDRLHVRTDQQALVFEPGEAFRFSVQPRSLGVSSGERLQLTVELFPARRSERGDHLLRRRLSDVRLPEVRLSEMRLADMAWMRSRESEPISRVQYEFTVGETDEVPVQVAMPEREGGYDIHLTAIRKGRGLADAVVATPLLRHEPVARRLVQVLVLANEPPLVRDTGSERLSQVGDPIDAADPGFWERLSKLPENLRKWRWLRNARLPQGQQRTRSHALGKLVELPPSSGGDYAWEAYMLPVREPGMPHVVEIDYPNDVEQTLAFSILEPNAAGAIHPLNVDGGIRVAHDLGGPSTPTWRHHRLVFWPRTEQPILLMINPRNDVPAVYGSIRVYAGWSQLPSAFPRQGPPPERFYGAYFHRPVFAESFNASDAPGPFTTQGVEDWVTFHEGGRRLVDYLRYAGYNGAVLTVFSEGSTLYPSRLLQPAPRYDTGVFAETGADPVRKDVLEMLLRMFDREGLQMLPALDFSTPLPQLEERIRREGRAAYPLRWIGPHGRPLTEGPEISGAAPYYNVLNPTVQEAILAVVHELVQRYGDHASFRGLGVHLSTQGYLLLPGPEWGMDDETVARFSEETGITLPEGSSDPYAQRAHLLLGEYRRQWLQWRAQRVHSLLMRIYQELTVARPDAKLVVLGGTMFADPKWRKRLQPSLTARRSPEDILLELGLDPQAMATQPGIVFVRPKRLFQDQPELNPVEHEIERTFSSLDWSRNASTSGTLLFHLPQEFHVASFDKQSPIQPSFTWVLTQPVPSGKQNRRRFAQAMASLDPQWVCDGGWRLPIGEESALRHLVAAYRQLPAVPFQTFVPDNPQESTQPVTVRYARRDGHTYAYLVNEAPFAVSLGLAIEGPEGTRVEELTGSRQIAPLRRDGENVRWTVQLEPYDLIAVRFNSSRIGFDQPRVQWSSDVDAALRERITEVSDRAATLRAPPLLPAPANAGFDQAASEDAPLPGWEVAASEEDSVVLDALVKHAGEYALRLSSAGGPVSVISEPFPAPSTGRLTLSLWLRVADADRQVPLRIFVEGAQGGHRLVRYAEIGVSDTGRPVPRISETWSPVLVEIRDLPLNDLSPLRLRIALADRGQVWVDDLQLCDLAFSKSERVALFKHIAPAEANYRSGDIADCLRVLDSYWPQYLLANVPRAGLVVSSRSEPPQRDAQTEERPDRSAGMLNRIRDLWPGRLLRF